MIANGLEEIIRIIPAFNYDQYLTTAYTKDNIITQYISEHNSYFKMQLFRQLYILETEDIFVKDEILKKFSDESYHIENDYTHCLDYNKFDIVPPYILDKINNYMNEKIGSSIST